MNFEPIAYVRNSRIEPTDDYWGGTISAIDLIPSIPAESLQGLEEFSHVEIIFCFDKVMDANIVWDSRHPRNNPDWPLVGIFAQRGKNRPNRIGATIAAIQKREGRSLYVLELDAIDGTPVLDIKPVLAEFLPRTAVKQPEWSRQLMKAYWLPGESLPRKS
jgi:tRNA (adenine37-N6)-methyltransferase